MAEYDSDDSGATLRKRLPSPASSDSSLRDWASRFDFPDPVHHRTSEADRRVKLVIKDGHDSKGQGMTFQIKYLDELKNAFDRFKAECCGTCRATGEIRFKTTTERVYESETPKTLGLLHNTTLEIKAHSNVPGLQCGKCRLRGYPKSTGVIDATTPLFHWRAPNEASAETITLNVRDQTGFSTPVKMLNIVSVSYLMDQYAKHAFRDRAILRFFSDGERLVDSDTPKALGLINDDAIEVFIEQLGG